MHTMRKLYVDHQKHHWHEHLLVPVENCFEPLFYYVRLIIVQLNTDIFISIIADAPDIHERWRIVMGQTIQPDSNRRYDCL